MPPFTGRHSQERRHAQNHPEKQMHARGPLHLSDLSDRIIPKASRIVANVLTPSGDLSAGIKRRQLFHFLELTIEIEGISRCRYRFFYAASRPWHPAEATCIVVDVLEDIAVCWRAGFPQIIIALCDI
jgi:hypothetical protein